MKYHLNHTTDKSLISQVLFDPGLISSLPDEDRIARSEGAEYEPCPTTKYLVIRASGNIVGIVRWKLFSNITIEAHVHILPKYWGSGITEEIADQVFAFWKQTTHCNRLVTFVPEDCKHVQKAIHRFGLEPTGVIPGGVIWNQRQQDLYIFSRDLNT